MLAHWVGRPQHSREIAALGLRFPQDSLLAAGIWGSVCTFQNICKIVIRALGQSQRWAGGKRLVRNPKVALDTFLVRLWISNVLRQP